MTIVVLQEVLIYLLLQCCLFGLPGASYAFGGVVGLTVRITAMGA